MPATRYSFELRSCRAHRRCGRWGRALRVYTAAAEPTVPPALLPAPAPAPQAAVCPYFPADNPINQDISNAPVDPNSSAYVNSIGASVDLHPDFGSDPSDGIPYEIVGPQQPLVPITLGAYSGESDPGPQPVPLDARVESGSDRHLLIVQSGSCKLYEMFNARRTALGWSADSAALFDLRSDAMRPAGFTSADAAGLPITPLLVRYDEVQSGQIDHALRFTAQRTQRGYVSPARHFASSDTNPALPPMGLRLRLKANFDISRFSGASRVVLVALKRYGMLVADNGSNWFISGSTDTRWSDADLNQLKHVPGAAFEAVASGPITTR